MSRKKLDSAEECLSACLPRDVASSVKQFFRELPEPVLPTEMQVALLKEHHLPTEKGRTCATMLLSCILPDTNQSVIGYFAEFLQKVSKRLAELQKLTATQRKASKWRVMSLHSFIENAHNFDKLPQILEEKRQVKSTVFIEHLQTAIAAYKVMYMEQFNIYNKQ
ncbi:inactive Rho GTPase-activating protein 11B-like isoform X1 [Hippocampus zosterae]|uniref:inactive Rho GTPase-activating protein 11B-like isoform X1 n=1 Tax=Hippocampus zosterae TaxID=109293 RepID=UPI00223CE5AF|nr:inactive Rho GTPase-activating protein 11B-like isoform X1 [Hippocampus zosterae]